MADRLDTPLERRGLLIRGPRDEDASGRAAEAIARFFGTPRFIVWLTVFCVVWIGWNTLGPISLRFDQASNGFTALTLMLSMQASYSAPLILLAQNRQADRDRVAAEQDRQRAERNLADTEFLAREMAAVRIALADVATRDFVRSELRDLLDAVGNDDQGATATKERGKDKPRKSKSAKTARPGPDAPGPAADEPGPQPAGPSPRGDGSDPAAPEPAAPEAQPPLG
ncbi:MAG: DUF1003 domain-containing protein [Actinobacteria bacterium]|nr:DUF1003 domain-containing protein [Actinomycetota bacterium]MCG2803557.1 DUF1003 domain-containing protein [Cellulomonas sp.]